MSGLDSTGFTPKRFSEISSDIKARLRSAFGSSLDTTDDSTIMQLINPIMLEIEESWQGSQAIYDFLNPAAAEGTSLDNIGIITNTPRIAGTKSTVTVTATGISGSVIPVGFQRAVEDTGDIFELTSDTGAQTIPVSGTIDFQMDAIEDGPIQCVAGTLTQGSLPSGVTDVVNSSDGDLGTYDETDEEYRVGRKARLAAIGGATLPTIKAALLSVDNVSSAAVQENVTDETVDSLLPHSIRCVVGGTYTNQDVIDKIGEEKGAGIATNGSISGTYTDSDGQTYTIYFDDLSDIDIYIIVTVTSKDSDYPADGDDQIEEALLDLESEFEPGVDVTLPRLQNAVTSVPGILAYTLTFGTSPAPAGSANITIDFDERANLDSANITVSS